MATRNVPVHYFDEDNAPITGLTPTVNVYRLSDGVKVVDAQAMTEIAEGCYNYPFTAYDVDEDYFFISDGGVALGTKRYARGVLANESVASAVKAKTDNLPSDPADESLLEAAISAVEGKVDTVDGVVDAIKLKTDNLPSDPADQSLVEAAITAAVAPLAVEANVQGHAADALTAYDPPTRAELTSDKAEIIVEVDANETKIDTIDGIVDAIKLKTDNLPPGVPKGVEFTLDFLMVSDDHITPRTALASILGYISKDGGAFAVCTNSVSEIGLGVYKITLTAAEMNADVVTLVFTASNCDQRTVTIKTSA